MEIAVVYVTASSAAEAEDIARTVVSERLAACANILPAIRSVYWWEGTLKSAEEVAFLLKTRADLVDRLTERVCQLHSYACPCVVALPVAAGNPAFLAWISSETVA